MGMGWRYHLLEHENRTTSTIIEKKEGIRAGVTCDYTLAGKLQYIFEKNKYAILEAKYEENVSFILLIPKEDLSGVQKEITEASSGQTDLIREGECIYGTVNGETIVFN